MPEKAGMLKCIDSGTSGQNQFLRFIKNLCYKILEGWKGFKNFPLSGIKD